MINTNFYETKEIYSDLEIHYIKLLNRIHDIWEGGDKAIALERVVFMYLFDISIRLRHKYRHADRDPDVCIHMDTYRC